jgi:hypothetical protein
MKIPQEIELYEDNNSHIMGGWEVDGAERRDVARYDGVLTMHEHFVDCVRNKKVPISDLRDVIRSIYLVDQIEGTLPE